MDIMRSVVGMVVLLAIAFVLSVNKKSISLRTVGAALLLQIAIGGIMLYFPPGNRPAGEPGGGHCWVSESQPFRGDLPAKHRTLPCGIPQSILQLLHGKNRHGKERSLIETKRPHGEHSAMRLLQSSAIGSTESAFPVFCPSRPAF